MDLSKVRVDVARVEKGDWVAVEAYDARLEGVELLVRGTGNADFERRSSELFGKMTVLKQKDPAERNRIMTTLLLETVLLDWRGITEGDQPVRFSREAAQQLLTDPTVPFLRGAVQWAANVIAESRAEVAAADRKN